MKKIIVGVTFLNLSFASFAEMQMMSQFKCIDTKGNIIEFGEAREGRHVYLMWNGGYSYVSNKSEIESSIPLLFTEIHKTSLDNNSKVFRYKKRHTTISTALFPTPDFLMVPGVFVEKEELYLNKSSMKGWHKKYRPQIGSNLYYKVKFKCESL